ncbi:MAG: radical SAM protein [Candidatus Altiarchaeota archaeon]|nr:radical SAM protein [Candidatus Altiarchaeota archaeon]
MKPAITRLALSLVDYCNINCKYCFLDIKNKGDQINFDHAVKFIEYIAPRVRPRAVVNLTGGEPTLYPKLLPLIKIIKEEFLDPTIMINTNGVLSEKLLDDLLELKVNFYMTFEGLPEIQDFERPFHDGGGTSKIVIENIKKICEVDPNKLMVRFNISKNKVGKHKEITEFLLSLGVKRVSSAYLTKLGRGKTYENADPLYCIAYAPDFYREFSDKGLSSMLKFVPTKGERFACKAGEKLLALTVDSKIVACPNLISSKDLMGREIFALGEVSDEVYFDKTRAKAFKDFAEQVPTSCKSCTANELCDGCPLGRTIKDPTKFKKDYCEFQKANVRVFKAAGLTL